MNVSRRTLIFGSALGAIIAPGVANACVRQINYPWQGRFWTRLWKRSVSAPRIENQLAADLIQGIVAEDRQKLDGLLGEHAKLFTCGDGTKYWNRAGEEFDRSGALEMLAGYINREGKRSFQIKHFATLVENVEYMIYVTI